MSRPSSAAGCRGLSRRRAACAVRCRHRRGELHQFVTTPYVCTQFSGPLVEPLTRSQFSSSPVTAVRTLPNIFFDTTSPVKTVPARISTNFGQENVKSKSTQSPHQGAAKSAHTRCRRRDPARGELHRMRSDSQYLRRSTSCQRDPRRHVKSTSENRNNRVGGLPVTREPGYRCRHWRTDCTDVHEWRRM